jgi:hypothetical protein
LAIRSEYYRVATTPRCASTIAEIRTPAIACDPPLDRHREHHDDYTHVQKIAAGATASLFDALPHVQE